MWCDVMWCDVISLKVNYRFFINFIHIHPIVTPFYSFFSYYLFPHSIQMAPAVGVWLFLLAWHLFLLSIFPGTFILTVPTWRMHTYLMMLPKNHQANWWWANHQRRQSHYWNDGTNICAPIVILLLLLAFDYPYWMYPTKECGSGPSFDNFFKLPLQVRSRLGEDSFIYKTFFQEKNITSDDGT